MRTVSFVDYFELDCPGNVYSKAMLTADVDNDNHNELIIGNVFGDLFIYRGFPIDGRPWAKASELGMITCLQVGDICNHGMNYLVTLSAEGWCHMFSIRPDTPVPLQDAAETYDDIKILKPFFKQRLSANCKSLVIADIDGDGMNELVVAHSDRVVRAYRWVSVEDGLKQMKPTNDGSKLMLIDKWTLSGQIGSITSTQSNSGRLNILVSQPGGAFVTLVSNASQSLSLAGENQSKSSDNTAIHLESNCDGILYHALGSVRARNPGVTTEVIGSISRVKKPSNRESKDHNSMPALSAPCTCYSAICTLDGTITLLDEDKILWSLYVDHQLFALNKIDITGDGMEEVVACSWDGQTYFINLSKEVVRFHFRENVAAFCAGMYTLDRERGNVPCLFYATFNNKVFVYYNIHMAQIGVSNLLDTVQNMTIADSRLDFASSGSKIQDLLQWYLYGDHSQLNDL